MALTEFDGLHLHCDSSEYVLSANGTKYCQYTEGTQVLEYYGINYLSVGGTFGCLLAIWAFNLAIAYYNLHRAVTKKK